VPGAITGSATVCGSSSNAQAYSISAVSGATTYAWSVSGGGSITGGQGTTNATVTWTSAGSYAVSVTAGNGTCNSTAQTKAVNVYTNNLSISLTPTAEGCYNSATGSIAQTRSGGSGNYTFNWSGSNGYSSTSTANPLTGLNSGTYNVTMADATCTGFTSATANTTITAPWAANAGTDFTSCAPAQLNGGYTGTLSSVTLFSENFESYGNALIDNASTPWRNYVISGSGYTWWAMNNGCTITGSRSMGPIFYDGFSTVFCDYTWDIAIDVVSFYVTPINATGYSNLKLNFNWKSYGEPDDGFNGGQPYDYGRVVYSTNGTTWIPVNSTKYYGQTATQTVTNLDLSALNGTSFYLGFEWLNDNNTGTNPPFTVDDVTITGTPSTPTYAWSAGTSNGSISNPTTSTGGTYTLSVTSNGCVSTDQVVVTVNTASAAPTGISGNPGTTITCGSSTILSPTGGTVGTGASAVFYAGNACLAGGYTQDWTSWIYGTQYNMNMNSVVGGILNVTSTGNDPMIDMAGLGSFAPATFRYVNIKYRVTAGTGGYAEIFFYNGIHNYAVGAEEVGGSLIDDGQWHILTLDMWSDPDYLTGGNILGWRFDWSSNSGVTMEFD